VTISINQVSRGTALKVNGGIFIIQAFEHVKPGKGSAFVRLTLKNIQTQQVLERTFKSSEKLDDVHLEEKPFQNLYDTAEGFMFMDMESFEQMEVTREVIGDDVKFLQENLQVKAFCYEGKVLKIELPIFIEADISHTEPGLKGDSSRAGNKPAQIETGATIQVPLFIEIGEKVKIDTRTGEYVERVKQ